MTLSWQNLIAIFGGEALALAAVGWLVKVLVSEWLKRATENFKTKLETNATIEIEHLKNSLQMVAAERQIRFSNLQEKRADVIADLYARLVIVSWQSSHFVHGPGFGQQPQQTEEYNNAAAKLRDFMEFLETHRIYLPGAVCDSLDKYVGKLNKAVLAIGLWGAKSSYDKGLSAAEFKGTIEPALRSFQEDIPSLRSVLEMEFRRIHGVEISEVQVNK